MFKIILFLIFIAPAICFAQVGARGWDRVAGLLPLNYEPAPGSTVKNDTISNLKNVITKLSNFSKEHITEKAYLHFDKPFYAAGDTIYFKAYVTIGNDHKLSDLSGVLHIDLINTTNKIDQSIKLQITDGVSWGDFALPDSLPKGDYRIRAYTNWMRNDGPGAFFEQAIPVGSVLNNHVPESSTTHSNIDIAKDIQFFPEGGALINGISSKIAFKAIGGNGLGVDVKGVVVDNENTEINTFSSMHLGMGYFYLTPQEGKTYKARLTYADGSQNTIDLPKSLDKGIVLTVNNDSLPKASVQIAAGRSYFEENKNKDYTLLIWSGGVATMVSCQLDSTVITLDILKRHLHTGINTITLFSAAGEPLCERLFFVQNYDQMGLDVKSDKTVYTKREKVNIRLKVKNRMDVPSEGHFSVAVIDEGKVSVNEDAENTILTNLLLTSDLKGTVEQPNYYFTNINDEKLKALDLVMLTHGYRRFEWKQLLNNTYPPIAHQPETGLEIAGIAKSVLGRRLANASVSLIPVNKGPVLTHQTDDKGNFRFSNLAFTDTSKFVLQAVNAKGKNNTQLLYNKELPGPGVSAIPPVITEDVNQKMPAYLENHKQQWDDYTKYGSPKGRVLKEVKIKARKEPEFKSQSLVPESGADQVIHGDKILSGGQLSTRLMGMLRGMNFFPTKVGGVEPVLFGHVKPLLVLVDGVPGSIDQVSTDHVETIEVLKPPTSYIYGSDGLNGILVITTRPIPRLKDIPSIGILPITTIGYYKARRFYSPKYENLNQINKRDLRTTIYWQPELMTDKDGNASFDYYNADGSGNYQVVIEGIDDKGNLGRRVYRYKVE